MGLASQTRYIAIIIVVYLGIMLLFTNLQQVCRRGKKCLITLRAHTNASTTQALKCKTLGGVVVKTELIRGFQYKDSRNLKINIPDDHSPLPHHIQARQQAMVVIETGCWRMAVSPDRYTVEHVACARTRHCTEIASATAAWGGAWKMVYRSMERKDLSPIALQRNVFSRSYTTGLLSM